jgi:hypothetical protein
MINALRRDQPSREAYLSYAMAALLGIGLATFEFPTAFLFPVMPAPGPFPEGDLAQHVVGQRYFIADAWRWPLLVVPALDFPEGANIGLTDSIPLFAMLLKALAPVLPAGFQGIGLWYAVSWVLQPVAAVWCLRAAGEKRWLPALCMAVVSVSMPAWWGRFGHAALTSHFLLLFGLGSYFILLRFGTVRHWCGATLLLCATLLVHPYLLFMNAALIAAVPATLLLRGDATWRGATFATACAMLAVLLTVWALGYLGTTGEGGFGRFAMNLLSPVWPAGSWFLGADRIKVHAGEVSGWEGYNYLGLGLLAGLALAAVVARRSVKAVMAGHGGLLLALSALTMLALSNRVGIGFSRIMELYPAPAMLEHFRSSGRLFWPVAYALALAVMLGLGGIRSQWLRLPALLAVAGLQFADATWLRDSLADELRMPPRPWTVDQAMLRPLFAAHRSLVLLPRWECMPGSAEPGDARNLILELLTLASETTIPVNTMYLAAWHGIGDCDTAAVASGTPRPGEVRILLPAERDRLLPLVPGGREFCRPSGPLAICTAD